MSNPSLLQEDNQQLKLFGSDQMDPALFSAEESAPQRIFTGARLFSQNPELYKAIIALSAEGLGAIRIGRILKVSAHTVQAVREREPEAVAIEKNRLANLSRSAARMCVEGIIEMLSDPAQVKKMGIKDLGIVGGILAEKAELLSGSPTARVLNVNVSATVDYDDYVRRRREEFERGMGLGAGKKEERAEVAGAARKVAGVEERAGGVEQNAAGAARSGSGEDHGQERCELGPGEDSGRQGIVAPGPSQRVPIALLEAHRSSVGPDKMASSERPVNIEENEGS